MGLTDDLVEMFLWALDEELPGHEYVMDALATFESDKDGSFMLIGAALYQLEQHFRCEDDDERAEMVREMIERWVQVKRPGVLH